MKKVFIVLLLSLFFVSKVSALTEAPIDINKMSMLEISDALDKGIITSEQLVNMYLERNVIIKLLKCYKIWRLEWKI